MKLVVLAAALVVVLAGGAVWLVTRPPVAPDAPKEAATVPTDAAAGDDGDDAGVRRHVRAPARERVHSTARDPGQASLDRARELAASGRPLEALEMLAALRKEHPEWFADGAHDAWLLELQRAVPDALQAAIAGLPEDEAGALLARALAVVTDLEQRHRLRRIAIALATDTAGRERVVVMGGATPEEQAALERHLAYFGPLGTGLDRTAGDTGPLAARLARIRERAASRKKPVEPLPIADPDASEQRRLDQLEKLRQRGAVGLLDHIHSGLAWLALHQAEDGRFSERVTMERCKALEHEKTCAEDKGGYDLATTALAALAFLDFRDQDSRELFEPSLSAAVSWLRGQIKEDGSFGRWGYEAGIALMALGQAASSSGDAELRADLERAWRHHVAYSANGYRYTPGQIGDLSVTGWFVQALETARDAGVTLPPALAPALTAFVRSTWLGDHRFGYTPGTGNHGTLRSVGMLSLTVLQPEEVEPLHDDWSAHLAAESRDKRLNLYTLYYDVRMELALRGELSVPRRAALDDFAALYQTAEGDAAGRFVSEPEKTAEAAFKKKHGRDPAVSGRDRWIFRGGTTLFTAFGILTLEHALYRR